MNLTKGPDLAQLKVDLGNQIDAQAEALRLQFVTQGSGQAMEYQQVQAEAVKLKAAVAAGETPAAADYPMLASTVGTSDGSTLEEVADSVLLAFERWKAVGALIRGTRIRAKELVNAALSVSEARQSASIDWAALIAEAMA